MLAVALLFCCSAAEPDLVLRLLDCYGNGTLTVHGLWPQAEWCGGRPFSVTAIDPLIAELDRWWPSCEPPYNNTAFWEHEYAKHGRCSPWPKEVDYFSVALSLRAEHPDSVQTCFDNDLNVQPCRIVCSPTACFHDDYGRRKPPRATKRRKKPRPP